MNKVIKILDITYKKATETDDCEGCAFWGNINMCHEYSNGCASEKFIWVKDLDARYTLAEIKKAVCMFISNSTWEDIQNQLEKTEDPEYIKYLELKAKYEGRNR